MEKGINNITEYYIFGELTNKFNYRIENNCIYLKNSKEYEGGMNNGLKNGKGIL